MADIGKTWHALSEATAALVGTGELGDRLKAALASLRTLHVDSPAFDAPALQRRLDALVHVLVENRGTVDHAREILDLFREASALYYVWWSSAGRSC